MVRRCAAFAAGVLVWWSLRARDRREIGVLAATVVLVLLPWYLLTGFSVVAAGAIAVANLIDAISTRVVLSWLVSRRRPPRGDSGATTDPGWQVLGLESVADVFTFLWAALAAGTAGTVVGMLSVAVAVHPPTVEDALSRLFRYLSGIILVGETGLAVTTSRERGLPPLRSLVGLVAVSIVVVATAFAFGATLPLGFAALLPLFWSSTRMPVPTAVLHDAAVSVAVVVLVLTVGWTTFAQSGDLLGLATTVQVFITVSCALAITASTAIQERTRINSELRSRNEQTERQAAELTTITSTIPDGLLLVDGRGVATLLNDQAAEFVTSARDGMLVSEVHHRLDGTLMEVDERPVSRALRGEVVRGLPVLLTDDLDDDRIFDVSAAPLPVGGDAEPDTVLLLFRDSSERYPTFAEIEKARKQAERLFSDAPQGIALVDPGGMITHANDALATLLGTTRLELRGRPLSSHLAEGTEPLGPYLDRTYASPHSRPTTDTAFRSVTGEIVHVALSSRVFHDSDGRASTILVNVVDISERYRHQQELRHLADHDVLTGLVNRRRFDAELRTHLERHDRDGHDGAVVLLDLDHFKEVNDTLGHATGDELLVSVAGLLRESLRAEDVMARLGGDEFAAILPGADEDSTVDAAQRIVDRVRAHTSLLRGVARGVTASVGAVTISAARRQGSDPMSVADLLVYDAKDAGRVTAAVLGPGSSERPRTGSRLDAKHRLERALDSSGLVVHLQPIFDLRTNRGTGAEALVRLIDGDRLVPPGEFVPLAEEFGLSPRLDLWVLREAIAVHARLRRDSPGFRLAINVSGRSIGDEDFARAATELLSDPSVDAASVVLEITETAAVADLSAARGFADALSGTGTRFALDDFGASYGSFYYLKHFDFDLVKIDGEFVSRLDSLPVDHTIVRSVVGVAHELGKQVIVEFVGSDPVLREVRALGIDYAQGFRIGRPVPVPEFVDTHLRGGGRR